MIDWDVKQTNKNKQTNKQNIPSQWFPVYPSRHLHSAEVVVPTRVHIPPYLQGLGSHADISVREIKFLNPWILCEFLTILDDFVKNMQNLHTDRQK